MVVNLHFCPVCTLCQHLISTIYCVAMQSWESTNRSNKAWCFSSMSMSPSAKCSAFSCSSSFDCLNFCRSLLCFSFCSLRIDILLEVVNIHVLVQGSSYWPMHSKSHYGKFIKLEWHQLNSNDLVLNLSYTSHHDFKSSLSSRFLIICIWVYKFLKLFQDLASAF